MSLPNLLLTGREGQLGLAFCEHWAHQGLDQKFNLVAVGRQELDITNPVEVEKLLTQFRPSMILNAAAYTNVDDAESNEFSAYDVNSRAVGYLATWCASNSCHLIHLSTDFVFDGLASSPYSVDADPNPLGVYGLSKREGELEVLSRPELRGTVIRTSWLYSERGQNFVRTILRLMSEGNEIRVVDDQVGSPTSVHSLCSFINTLISDGGDPGLYHFTDGGEISWYDFAVTIREEGIDIGLLSESSSVNPVKAKDYTTAARRPSYSVLSIESAAPYSQGCAPDWRKELRKVLIRIHQRNKFLEAQRDEK